MTGKSHLAYSKKTVWERINDQDKQVVTDMAEDYKRFINLAKTERETVAEICACAIANGFAPLEEIQHPLCPGDRVFRTVRGKAALMAVIGDQSLEEGVNIIGAHVDSPRLDLKAQPLYEDLGLALLNTHYYGGIKKYQWLGVPLALHGVIIKDDGTAIQVKLGEDYRDPVFTVADLLPHLAKDQMDKKLSEAFPGESLDAICGGIPSGQLGIKEKYKEKILELLNNTYGIVEEDLISAELALVPATRARDVGLDRSLLGAYGQDDRACVYGLLEAIAGITQPRYTAVGIFVDKEEIGSVGNTGMQSSYFGNFMAELLERSTGRYDELQFRRLLANSRALSADVNAGLDPNFADVMEKNNAATLGCGVVLTKYTGSGGKKGANDAHAEYMAQVRSIFNAADVIWQTGELGKVDQGGGGTIAYMLAAYGMDVVDCGVALLGMHSPFEICHKSDLFMMWKGYRSFFLS